MNNIRIISTNEYNLWDQLVAQSPQGTLFHTSDWLKASGRNFKIYGYFKGDELFAGLPVVYSTSRLGVKFVSHPALTPYMGPVFRNSNSKYVTRLSNEKEISRAFAQKLKQNFDFVYFQLSPKNIDPQPFIWEGFQSGVRCTYILDISDLDSVWSNMDSSKRNHIRRAEKDGIIIEVGCSFERMFSNVEKTFQRQGLKADFKKEAYAYYSLLVEGQFVQTFVASNKNGEDIASVLLVSDRHRSYQLLAGYDPVRTHNGATALAIWEAIRYSKITLSLNEYDFEGSMIEPVEQFFRKFGGRLTPYYTVSWAKSWVRALHCTRSVLRKAIRKK